MYSEIYDFRTNKYLKIKSREGINLINSYKQIYNNLNSEGKSEVNKLFKLPLNLIENKSLNYKKCNYCNHKNINDKAKYCNMCGKIL